MNIRTPFTPLVVLLVVTIATIQPASAIAPDHGPAAFGQGQFTFNGNLINFAFEARANKNGNARGRAIFDNLSDETRVVVRINCLRVTPGEALMTGKVLHSNDPAFPKSANVIFAAIDGQGLPVPSADIISPLFVSPFPDCQTGAPPLTLFQLDGDAIQIEP